MRKLYYFLSSRSLKAGPFQQGLLSLGVKEEDIVYEDSASGYFHGDSDLIASLDDFLVDLVRKDGAKVSLLCYHRDDDFGRSLAKEAFSFFPCQVSYPLDVILKQMSFGNFVSFAPLMRLFRGIPEELLLTAGAYLRCGMDAVLAGKRLDVHRNTMLYRLKSFIELTGLDIREYHNASLLELYFLLSKGR